MINNQRVLLIDPCTETRGPLLGILQSMAPLVVVDVQTHQRLDFDQLATKRPDVIMVVTDNFSEAAEGVFQTIRQRAPDIAIVGATASREAERIVSIVRAGAHECLLLPTLRSELETLFDRLDRHLSPEAYNSRRASVITVVGATGGVGCTSVALHLAVASRREGVSDVALADLDLFSGKIASWLDLYFETSLSHLIEHSDRIDPLLLRRAMTEHAESGVMVLPGLREINEIELIVPETLRYLLEHLKACFEVVVLDTSKGLHATDMVAMQAADTLLVVTQPDVLTLSSTQKLLQVLDYLGHARSKIELVLNRVGTGHARMGVNRIEDSLGLPVRWVVPNNYRAILEAQLEGRPVNPRAGGRKICDVFQEMAVALMPASLRHADGQPARGEARTWSERFFGRNNGRSRVALT